MGPCSVLGPGGRRRNATVNLRPLVLACTRPLAIRTRCSMPAASSQHLVFQTAQRRCQCVVHCGCSVEGQLGPTAQRLSSAAVAGADDARGFVYQVLSMNTYQQQRFTNNIVHTMVNVKGKKIALMGFAYKPNTSDCRQSPAIDIAKAMIAEGAHLAVFDPQVQAEVVIDALGNVPTLQVRPCHGISARSPGGHVRAECATVDSHCSAYLQVTICKNAMEAVEGADAMVLVTDWECFGTLDMQHGVYHVFVSPAAFK